MAQRPLLQSVFSGRPWICRRCRVPQHVQRRLLSSSANRAAEVEIIAAAEIDLSAKLSNPARLVPASPSYFTGTPIFNDNLLFLQMLITRHSSVPTVPAEKAPRIAWQKLSQYRNSTGENVGAAKYAQLVVLLGRLNRIHPSLRPAEVKTAIAKFQRPGAAEQEQPKLGTIDQYGRSNGIGRRKASRAKVYLVEGTGEVLVNGKNIVEAFPRLHDRESVLWPLKISERIDKYNVFALTRGGGLTGQAEAITLGLAKALLVHEPALKPALRRAGCVTRDPRRVERKKAGRVKARKRPTWVKR